MKFHNLHSPAQHRQRRLRRLRGCAILTAMAFVLSLASFQVRSAGVRQQVLRLHVVANSNSVQDQQAKYFVRDAILAEGTALFDRTLNLAEAQEAIVPRLDDLEHAARRALQELGLDQPVRVRLGTAFFNTRNYQEQGLTFPAGRYQAVEVFLGESAGENWWCVMFPPLCLPAATPRRASLDAVLTDGQMRVIESNPRYEVRFWVVEQFETLRERFTN